MCDLASAVRGVFSDPASTPPDFLFQIVASRTGGPATVDHRWFYRDEPDWIAFRDQLKLTACPHCRVVGTLNQHGSLVGFDDSSPQRKTLRARRLFCSNRGRRLAADAPSASGSPAKSDAPASPRTRSEPSSYWRSSSASPTPFATRPVVVAPDRGSAVGNAFASRKVAFARRS